MKIIKAGIATILLLSSIAWGSETQLEFCQQIHETAKAIMEARQAGVALPKMMSVMTNDDYPESVVKIHNIIILAAYEKPQYSTERLQENTITTFANDVSLECYQGINK